MTPSALPLPTFSTLSVYVSVPLAATGSGLSDFLTLISATSVVSSRAPPGALQASHSTLQERGPVVPRGTVPVTSTVTVEPGATSPISHL